MAAKRRSRTKQEAEATEESVQGKITKDVVLVSSSRIVDGHKEEYDLEVQKFVTDPAFVRVSAGQTRQIVEFESVRVDIAVTIPCYKEEVEDVIAEATEMVADRLEKELDFYLGAEEDE